MKIKTRRISWEKAATLGPIPHLKPVKPWFLLALVIRILSFIDLFRVPLSVSYRRVDEAGDGPKLILMNHSSFLDLKIASKILFPEPYHIVSTTDAFVGKSLLMRLIGCIPTQKFVTDVALVMDMLRIIKKQKRSVLMYPEAGYSFDGTATSLPQRMGGLFKRLGVPVMMIRTDAGAFLRDPLYNGLRLRKVKVKAEYACLLTPEEIREKSAEELDAVLAEAFSFDHFRQQREEKIRISEPFRATGLERVLYRCPHCHTEGQMKGEGEHLSCHACGKRYRMDEYGTLSATEGDTAFDSVPAWYAWERSCVREAVEKGEYSFSIPVRVGLICDHKAMYLLGEGTLSHSRTGFTLQDDKGNVVYTQDPWASYSLNSDFFFYEIGDMISLGTKDRLYYCFVPEGFSVTRARLATEEIYKMPKVKA